MKNYRRKIILSVVYFVVFSNIVGGLCSITLTRNVDDIAPLKGLFIMLGLFALAGALVLLVGAIKENDRFILVYLILATMVIAFTTILISVLIIPKLKVLEVHTFVIVYLVLIVVWPILYCVYLFYKDLLTNRVMPIEMETGDNEGEGDGATGGVGGPGSDDGSSQDST